VLDVDGSTFTMPDTPENQAEYPQVPGQRRGCLWLEVHRLSVALDDAGLTRDERLNFALDALNRMFLWAGMHCPGGVTVNSRGRLPADFALDILL
jgi:hypothetical protein